MPKVSQLAAQSPATVAALRDVLGIDTLESSIDATLASGDIYPDTASGLAATTTGQYFSVPGANANDYLILYRNSAGSAVEVKRYPSAERVPVAGKLSGWPDPFFRAFNLTSRTFYGRDRWYWNNVGTVFQAWTRVENSVFDGYALRRTANAGTTPLNGPSIYLDDIGAKAGDTITVYGLFTGAGAVANFPAKFDNGSQLAAPVNVSGGGNVTTSATPQWLRYEVTVPAGAVSFDTYPYTSTAGQTFDLVALWAFKGAASSGPAWPTLPDGVQADLVRRMAQLSSGQALNNVKSNYAIDSYSTVSASASTTVIDVSGPSLSAFDLPFMGWGETYEPDGVTFNALRIRAISRQPGATAQWRTLGVVIRTGAAPNAAGSAVVAIGTASVVESANSLADVTFLLRDPITGAPKTLSDASFTDDTYFIGVYALTSAFEPAACGEPRGTLSNSKGQSYYHLSSVNAPLTGGWVATISGNNNRLGFQHLQLTAPVESYVNAPTAALAVALAGILPTPAPEIVLPSFLFGVQGREMNVYLDNLHLGDASEYWHNVDTSTSVGAQQNERFTWTPSGAQASGTLTVAVHDKRQGASLVSKTAQLRAAASNAGSGLTKKVLVIGDSLVAAGTTTQTLVDIAAGDVMAVTTLGTQGSGANKHEGHSGWTVALATTSGSPFYISGAVNFGQYLVNNSIATPDWVFIALGINDIFNQTDDATCSALADSTFTSLDTLIASIKAAGASIKVGLVIPTPPSADQDAFADNYGAAQTRWRFKRNVLIWARQLCTRYNGQEASRIYVVPSNTALDTTNNMSRASAAPINSRTALTSQRQNNGVHPAAEGYRQIGDALWAFLKFYA